MEINEFNNYWKQEINDYLSFGYGLRQKFSDKWFRIHSLPKSKRYADTEAEYQIIYDRQNKLITDVFGKETEVIVLFNLFTNDISNAKYYEYFDFTEFKKSNTLDLHKINAEEYDTGLFIDVYIKTIKWKENTLNKILKGVADDEIRVLLICPSKNRIVAPYDGGVDVIMENEEQRNAFKLKYKDWLSYREDGL